MDELFWDDASGWRVCLHRDNGYSEDMTAVLLVDEPSDKTKLYACTAKRRGPGAYVSAIGEVIAEDEERRAEWPQLLLRGVERFRREGEAGAAWEWQWASEQGRRNIDLYLIATKHPLAEEPGTPESRFRQLVREIVAAS